MSVEPHEQIAVLVADRQPLFLDGLARTIRRDAGLRLVADVADEDRVLEDLCRLVPDVAVVDAELDALRLLGAVAQHRLTTRVAVMAARVTPDRAFDAVAAGARGYLSKRAPGETVCAAIRRIAAGGSVLCDEAQTSVTSEIRLRHEGAHRLLTARELDVLRLIACELTYREIGRRLHLSSSTVKTNAERIYERLGARGRVSAVLEAKRRGILD